MCPIGTINGLQTPTDALTFYLYMAGLFSSLGIQLFILAKIEHEYNKFLLGQNKRGLWANVRLGNKIWNDKIKDFCEANDIEIVYHRPIRYPTCLADLMDNY